MPRGPLGTLASRAMIKAEISLRKTRSSQRNRSEARLELATKTSSQAHALHRCLAMATEARRAFHSYVLRTPSGRLLLGAVTLMKHLNDTFCRLVKRGAIPCFAPFVATWIVGCADPETTHPAAQEYRAKLLRTS